MVRGGGGGGSAVYGKVVLGLTAAETCEKSNVSIGSFFGRMINED